jgi:hypothetical protein
MHCHKADREKRPNQSGSDVQMRTAVQELSHWIDRLWVDSDQHVGNAGHTIPEALLFQRPPRGRLP